MTNSEAPVGSGAQQGWPDPVMRARLTQVIRDPALPPPITIALASYNGAAYLPTQLESFRAQSEADWNLLVSDDGSNDATRDQLEGFIAGLPVGRGRLIEGPKAGSTRNFLHLTAAADPEHWLAYSDQDDKWLPEKLGRARAFLADKTGPAIYAARTTICDEELNILAPAPAFTRPLTFRNALIQACLPGNTIVANAPALRLLQEAAPAAAAAGVVSHDWWAFQLLSGAGAVIKRDRAQVLLYRQHGRNLMGRNDTPRAKAARLSLLGNGTFAEWLDANQAALEPVAHLMTAENRALLARFRKARDKSGAATAKDFLAMGLYRQTRLGTLAVLAAASAGRLAPRQAAV